MTSVATRKVVELLEVDHRADYSTGTSEIMPLYERFPLA